ncbi:HvfC family RiPP maturation protein [Pseudoxanthomonas sp. 10H]|uniref:HvfC family RiPP maturation protein n=1 Tax=Pseudoxanthomonas sp. 10H TaxID=3242729 RepID=UPI0035569B4A
MSDLHAQQAAFAAHLRDPAAHPAPGGIEPRRMAVYRDLFFNNIAGLLAGNFPVIRRTLGEVAWIALVRRFYAGHRCQTPLFPELAREFIRFLEARPDDGDPPWLAELAHYEWIELAVQIDDSPLPAHDPAGDLLDGIPVVSPWIRALAYRWPVHTIGPDHRPDAAPEAPTLLLVRRDAAGAARFAAISPLVYRLLEGLGEGGASGGARLRALAAEAGVAADPAFLAEGAAMLGRMRGEGTLLGVQPA